MSRYPVLLAWTDTCVTRSVTGSLALLPSGANPARVIVLADPDLFEFDSRFENTHWPCDQLWGPGDPAGAQRSFADHHPEPDKVKTIDRLFLIQYRGDRLTLPRSPGVAAALGPGDRDGTWYLIRADAPSHAFNHQRRLLAGESGHAGQGDCKACPAEVLGNGKLSVMLHLAERLGADVMPRPVRTARVTMSPMPTCNRFLPGSGWEIPPDDPSLARLLADMPGTKA